MSTPLDNRPRDQWPLKQADEARAYAAKLITADIKKMLAEQHGLMPERGVVMILTLALFDAVREEWKAAYTAAGLENEVTAARQLMAADGYKDPVEFEPICGMPGAKPMICKVDGKDAVAFTHSMGQMMPLSAYYTDKVREAIDIAAMVGELIGAKNADHERPKADTTDA
jgi:hypothetical protein